LVRASGSPASAVEFTRTYFETDLSEVLPTISVPKLVLYRPEVKTSLLRFPVETTDIARELGERIPDARLVQVPEAVVPDRVLATVLFTDIVGATERAVELGDKGWRDLLAAHRTAVRRGLALYRGVELDTAGDGFFASFDGPARAIACARRIVDVAQSDGVQVRTGIHTGECERDGEKLSGLAVHIGARIAALAGGGEVLVSRTVKDLVAGSGIDFEERGRRELKGVPGEWELYAVSA
jgi:class 3 adenylate cyclase